jgi:hypothetical protein
MKGERGHCDRRWDSDCDIDCDTDTILMTDRVVPLSQL